MQSFDEIYNKLKENYKDLDNQRKKTLCKSITIALVIIVLFIISILLINHLTPVFIAPLLIAFFLVPASLVFLIVYFSKKSKKFNREFKETVIYDLIKMYDSNLYFSPDSSIRASKYDDAEFEMYDEFHSNDYIYGKLKGAIEFELSDVRTVSIYTDSEGNRSESTIFKGLFSAGSLGKNINGKIKIHSDKGLVGKFTKNKDLLHMDSLEFEKYFDVYSEQKILAMRILTSDLMDYLINFKKENKIKFEITIKNSSFYIRIHCSDMFEGNILKNVLDYNTLKKYYNYLNFMCTLNQKIYNILAEKDL